MKFYLALCFFGLSMVMLSPLLSFGTTEDESFVSHRTFLRSSYSSGRAYSSRGGGAYFFFFGGK